MSLKQIAIIVFLFIINISTSQNITDTTSIKNGISKPSILSTNTFGMFFMRLNHNFKFRASKRKEIDIALESGNVWGPNVKTYIPDDESVRNGLRDIAWFSRQFLIDEDTLDGKNYEIKTDGIIKGLRANITIPIKENQELIVGLRTFMLTKGKFPFSAITGDGFIEYFHNNIAGGDDPFDRKVFGYDQAEIKYRDRNGNHLDLDNGSFVFGGVETHYYYYPKLLNSKKIYMNFGAHLGANMSKYNSSIDLGLSGAAVKQINFNARSYFLFGLGLNAISKKTIDLQKDNVDFGTNNFIGSLETDIEYTFTSKGKTNHSFGMAFYIQTSLNKRDEFNYAVLVKDERAFDSWQHASKHLYETNNYWTLVYTLTKKVAWSFYLQQDLTVNNNPDIQTGIGVKFGI